MTGALVVQSRPRAVEHPILYQGSGISKGRRHIDPCASDDSARSLVRNPINVDENCQSQKTNPPRRRLANGNRRTASRFNALSM